MAVLDTGGSTAGKADVDANFNLKTNLPTTAVQAGYAALAVEEDDGTVTGAREVKKLYATESGRLAVGADTSIFNAFFPGTVLDTNLWTSILTTMTQTVASGFTTLNAGSSAASGAVAQTRTYRHFPNIAGYSTRLEMLVQFPFVPVTNNECIWGWVLMATTAAPTDGVYFILNATGEFRAVVNLNGTINQSGTLNFATLVGANATKEFLIEIQDEECHFYIGATLVAKIAIPSAGAGMTMSNNLPVAFRTQNTAATGSAQQMKIAAANVTLCDALTSKSWPDQLAGQGGNAAQGQTGQATLTSTANYVNSTNPTAAVPTNTTAALGSGIGGQFWETDTLAVTTDGIIQDYLNPLGTAAIPGKTLYITNVGISSYIQTVLTGGPYTAQWSLAYGHTAISLATADGATTKAPRRLPLPYTQQVTAAQAVNTAVGTNFLMALVPPIVVQPGEHLALVKKKIGTAPSAGVVAHVITYTGYWE